MILTRWRKAVSPAGRIHLPATHPTATRLVTAAIPGARTKRATMAISRARLAHEVKTRAIVANPAATDTTIPTAPAIKE